MEDFISGQDTSKRQASNQIYLQQLQQRVNRVNELEAIVEELDDNELQQKTIEFQKRIQIDKEDINGPIVEEVFAVVREAAWYVFLFTTS